mmetsp:Transcript_4493/g.12972  ORF Transcript_4493/g.12972 Transcript_4493/m.12972 type:complete len:1561 (-) Transcript_4493:211-4893(-)
MTTDEAAAAATASAMDGLANASSWKVRDAAENLLARRGLKTTSLVDGKNESSNDNKQEMTLSKYFDINPCQSRLRRDKTPIVKLALDAAASALLENLHKADDDDEEHDASCKTYAPLPVLLEDIFQLQALRVESMERAHANKDLAKRRIAVANEQEKEKEHRAQKQRAMNEKLHKLQDEQNSKKTLVSASGGGTATPDPSVTSSTAGAKVKTEDTAVASKDASSAKATTTSSTSATTPIKQEPGIQTETTASTASKKQPQPLAPTASPKKEATTTTPKFTRNTPALSASALETRLTGSRAILCTAANVAFDALTPAFETTTSLGIDVADVPQNPANVNNTTTNYYVGGDATLAADDKPATATVPNMGPVIIEAQLLGKLIENVATNISKRSKRRFRFRKDNLRFRTKTYSSSNNNNTTNAAVLLRKREEGFQILKKPFAWKDDEDDEENNTDGVGSSPMDVDESASVVTADSHNHNNNTAMPLDVEHSKAWKNVCIPRLLSILQTGVGNAILHDVLWSTRHVRIANLLQKISTMSEKGIGIGMDTTGGANSNGTDGNFGPHLIVTVGPDVDKFASQFQAPNSHLRLMSSSSSSSDGSPLRALAYKGTPQEKRQLRLQFPHATGLADAAFHVICVSYADFLQDYLHFCQTPFEVVLFDDGVSWMAAAHNDSNSPIATVWEDALFSKNDHQMGLAGTTLKEWDYHKDTQTIPEETLKEARIGLTAKHRLLTSSKLRVENPRSPPDLLPVAGLLSFVLPHFSDALKEEWDRSRIANDASSMSHFRKLLTRSLVVHDPTNNSISSTDADVVMIKTEDREQPPPPNNQNNSSSSIYDLAIKTLKGDMPESIRAKDYPPVPKEISDDRFIADGKVASSRRSALQWLGPVEDSWLRYELGTVSFQPILAAMKTSLMYGHICEEITTALSVTTGYAGQIIGNLAWKLGVRSGKSFGSEQGLRQHLSTHHAPPGTWLCRTCKIGCITSQARTHHERSCGQPSSGRSPNAVAGFSGGGASKKDTNAKKKGKAGKGGAVMAQKEEKDADGSVRVPSYRGVWVDQAGKYFIKIKSEQVVNEKKKPPIFESIEEAAKKYDALVKSKDKGSAKLEYNYKPDGTRIVYEDVSTTSSSTTGLGGGVVPALSMINIEDLPPDVKPLLRDPRQTSRTGGNSKRHVYAYRGVCRQARKGHDRWQSQISFLGVNHYLGTFDSEWDAAAIYAWAHLILYGEEATRQAQKEGEEAAAAYEQEKKDIAAGKIPAAPPKPEKKAKQAAKKKADAAASKKGKKDAAKEDKGGKRKPGRPKKKADEPAAKAPPGKRAKVAAGKEDIASILAQSVGKANILAPVPKFVDMSDEELMKEAASRMVAARSVNYCVTEVPLPAPIHMDYRPCVPWREESDDQMGGGALLVGIDPSLFGWNIDSIVSQQYFGSDSERRNATEALTEEFGPDGLNENFKSLVQGSTTVIGCASSRMKRVYSSLVMGSPPMGAPIGPIDCNTGGNSKCCSETAACIRYVPTDTGDFQLTALSTDLITMNGQRITPEMGSFALFHEDICTIGSRVFLFLLPSDT